MSLNIAAHDLETKLRAAQKFLDKGEEVKLTVMLRGRQKAHPERARDMLEGLAVSGRRETPVLIGAGYNMLVRPNKG